MGQGQVRTTFCQLHDAEDTGCTLDVHLLAPCREGAEEADDCACLDGVAQGASGTIQSLAPHPPSPWPTGHVLFGLLPALLPGNGVPLACGGSLRASRARLASAAALCAALGVDDCQFHRRTKTNSVIRWSVTAAKTSITH